MKFPNTLIAVGISMALVGCETVPSSSSSSSSVVSQSSQQFASQRLSAPELCDRDKRVDAFFTNMRQLGIPENGYDTGWDDTPTGVKANAKLYELEAEMLRRAKKSCPPETAKNSDGSVPFAGSTYDEQIENAETFQKTSEERSRDYARSGNNSGAGAEVAATLLGLAAGAAILSQSQGSSSSSSASTSAQCRSREATCPQNDTRCQALPIC